MTAATQLGSMFNVAPIIVWVEDSLTRDYLSKVWNDDPEIAFFLAGNSTAVRPVVEAARFENLNHVFGIVDRVGKHRQKISVSGRNHQIVGE